MSCATNKITNELLEGKSIEHILPLQVVSFLVLRFVSCLHHCSKLGNLTRWKISRPNVAFGPLELVMNGKKTKEINATQ